MTTINPVETLLMMGLKPFMLNLLSQLGYVISGLRGGTSGGLKKAVENGRRQ
jgi:hypothetical protein